MRLEARFGDRFVPAFFERPKSIWAMIADAAARNPEGEALVCAGLKIYSAEVELVLAGHPAVVESAIIAKPRI
jgi:long-chain acyl-CoA synthetase